MLTNRCVEFEFDTKAGIHRPLKASECRQDEVRGTLIPFEAHVSDDSQESRRKNVVDLIDTNVDICSATAIYLHIYLINDLTKY